MRRKVWCREAVAVVALLACSADLLWATGADFQDSFEARVQPFLKENCYSCHNAKVAKSGFRVDTLGVNFLDGRMADHWKEAMDRINLGEMPPEEEIRPQIEEIAIVVDWINRGLREAELQARNAGGAIPVRRLNRVEYANTVRDLFGLDAQEVAPLVESLPADGQAEGFDRLGVALFFDQTQLDKTFEVASAISEKVIIDMEADASAETPTAEVVFEAEETERPNRDTVDRLGGGKFQVRSLEPIPFGDFKPYEIEDGGVEYRTDAGKDDPMARVQHFRITDFIREPGYYRVRIHAQGRGAPEHPHKLRLEYSAKSSGEVVEELPLDPSGVTETTLFLRPGPSDARRSLAMFWNHWPGLLEIEPNLEEAIKQRRSTLIDYEKAKKAGESQAMETAKAADDAAVRRLENWKTAKYRVDPEADLATIPRLFVDKVTIEGPVYDDWPPVTHKRIFFDGDERRDAAYAREIIERILPFAYRRPVSDHEVDAVARIATTAMDDGRGFYDAMRLAFTRILASPKFLFLIEPSGSEEGRRPLTDFELASRLSYLLWSSMPDTELFAVARAGKLTEPDVLVGQVGRMLMDPKASAFVKNFAGQWLNVREFGTVEPAREYRDYDDALRDASMREPFEFFSEILSNNLPITAFIDSDFVMVNDRLAKHYGLEGVEGEEFRKVAITPEDGRGGVLGMAGLMTLLSDGTRTLPIRRATWVKEKLFDDPPGNPPPNAGEIQPNTQGEHLTVRERLELHRQEPTCASCHATLDPFGLALENYDVIGAWRDRANGENFRGANRPELDVSGTLPNGTAYEDLQEFKQALLEPEMRHQFARAFSKQLLTYALGRPVGYTDTTTLDAMVAALEQNDYRIHSAIAAVITSEPFLTK